MSSTFAIGDIHGGLKALEQVLDRAPLQRHDKLIFLGDYVDGWSQSPEVLDYLMQLKKKYECVFIRGNHDDLLLKWFKEKTHNDMWYHHGGEATVTAYKKFDAAKIDEHIAFLEQLEDYHLDKQNRLFVHAGFTNLNGVEYEYFPKMFYWERTLWETALALDPLMKTTDLRYPKRFTLYKEIYIGHTPVTRIEETVPMQMANVWNIDTGAAFKGPLTVINVDTKEFWQSDPVYTLYKKEKGRN